MKFLPLFALLALGACNASQMDAVKKACDADAILQPVVAPVGAIVSPAASAVVVVDTSTIHPAVTALCASLEAPKPAPVVPAVAPVK